MTPRALTLPAVVLLGIGALAGCAGTDAVQSGAGNSDSRYVAGDNSSQIIKNRKPAPQVKGTTLDGKPYDLAAQSGKVTVVNFWASWCAPCRAEAPTMEQIYEQTKGSGVQFLGVDIKDGKDNAQAFLRTFKITYPSLYDQAGQVALAFRDIPPNAVPSTLVIDRHGKVAVRIIGSVPYSHLRDLVTKVAAEK
ncbi:MULTISPECIES: TlpA family protein disulfide reductase [Actinoallomurus]|uniref:TlpA family protein disulfide reductase n=1 Tax=Actinoallomurus TaxID=667113 RepID=UPI00209157DC|nr:MULTISPECIES: TlpA disulfide reductase family protein [Actinoallomurus]MCO5968027.1 TlpA family protein disulfide reductase [Actinoallomurus soli]MCO5994520.1 TlpA family protein disulfide reductase [Actinoallomurus rhizosphaericola]